MKPIITENYQGGDIVLNAEKGIALTPADFPELLSYCGQTIVSTDGTTLLGADDKAGVAAGSSDTKSSLAKEMKSLDSRIDTTNSRISAMQERYYKQFDALETMMQRLNSQSSWISQLFGGSSQ